MRTLIHALAIMMSMVAGSSGGAQDFKLEEVPTVSSVPVAELKPRTVIFSEQPHGKPAGSGATELFAFEDWSRERPLERRLLSLFPEYDEPILMDGLTLKLSVYVAEARFRLPKPAQAFDLARYTNIDFLERIDSAVQHRPLAIAEAIPNKDVGPGLTRPHSRKWCEQAKVCVQSRYDFEGKIPSGILLLNKLREETKKPIPGFIEFQSEIRLLSLQQPGFTEFARLTGLNAPVRGVFEQNMFWINQIMQFGKLVAVVQDNPVDSASAIVTIYLVLAIRDDVLNKQRNFAGAPVLRNLVPAQLLMGRSSFNTGNSISAGLPHYARSRIKAIAGIIERE